MRHARTVAILVFEDAEVLDVTGPYEVFSVTGRRHELEPFEVFLVAERSGPVTLRNGFSINPHHTFATAPAADLLLIPGGMGTRREINNAVVVDWIRQRAAAAELILSVCTGALLLGKAGLLDGLEATTHYGAVDLLREVAPKARVVEGKRYVDNGTVILSEGVSAGIDMALHVVERLLGYEFAEETAHYMQYHWEWNESGIEDEGL